MLSGAPRAPSHRVPLRPSKKTDVSALHHWDCDKLSTLKCRHRNRFFPIWHTLRRHPYGSRQQLCVPSSHFPCVSSWWLLGIYNMAAFTSTIGVIAEQPANSPQLEPAFEHLLRNSNVHVSIISTLRVNAVTDRDTFVNMFDSEAALKDGASDLGFDLTAGGLAHKRDFARVVTSWKTAKIMAETKLQTGAVAKAHGMPVTLLPCDWTSILTEFMKKTEHKFLMTGCQRSPCLSTSRRS